MSERPFLTEACFVTMNRLVIALLLAICVLVKTGCVITPIQPLPAVNASTTNYSQGEFRVTSAPVFGTEYYWIRIQSDKQFELIRLVEDESADEVSLHAQPDSLVGVLPRLPEGIHRPYTLFAWEYTFGHYARYTFMLTSKGLISQDEWQHREWPQSRTEPSAVAEVKNK